MPASKAARSRSLHRNHFLAGSDVDIYRSSDDIGEQDAGRCGEQRQLDRRAAGEAEGAGDAAAEVHGGQDEGDRDCAPYGGERANAATCVLETTANAFGRSVHAHPRAGSYRSAYRKSAGARENEIASANASANRPRSPRVPKRRAAHPSSPSRRAARKMKSAAAVNRPSAT